MTFKICVSFHLLVNGAIIQKHIKDLMFIFRLPKNSRREIKGVLFLSD